MSPAPPFIKMLLNRTYQRVIFILSISQFCEPRSSERGEGEITQGGAG
ncbi:hypothetical protein ES703_28691 [subsurface metagenome]